MNFNFKNSLMAAGALLALGLGGSGTANAASVASLLFPGETNLISDNSAEYLINSNGTRCGDVGGDCTVDVNDRLRAIFKIDTVEDLTGGGGENEFGTGGNNELSGISDITVVAKLGGPGDWTFVFAPTAGFAAEIAGLTGGAAIDFAGTAIALFEDTTPDFIRTNCTVAACEAAAVDGTFRLALGFDGDPDNIWIAATETDDISVVGATQAPLTGGGANAQVNVIQNNGFAGDFDPQFVAGDLSGPGGDSMVDFVVTISLLGTGGANTPFDAFDDVNATFVPIAEPTSLALIGMGLVAAGIAVRRRRKA